MSAATRLDQVSGILKRHTEPKEPTDRGLILGAIRTLHEVREEVSETSLLLDKALLDRSELMSCLNEVSDRKTIAALNAVVEVLRVQLIEEGYAGTHRTEIYRSMQFINDLRRRLQEGRWKVRK